MVPANPRTRPNVQAPAAVVAGDFSSVYRAYFGFAWRCLQGLGVPSRHLDDAAQDVFVVVHRRLPDFRAESSLRTWLYGIVRNVAANHRRGQRRRPPADALEAEPESGAAGPHELALDREAREFVQAFLSTLDDARRELFVLVLLEELSVPEASEMLQVPLNTAYTRLRSVRHAFERALAERK